MASTLIRGAYVLTMDPSLGELPRGDVLIDGDRIANVGVDLPSDGAEVIDGTDRIVMPGLVDTHRHMWAAMLRGCACYGSLGDYFHDVVFTYGANFAPDDTYASVSLGLAEAIDAGITTMHAWEHNMQTPAHADAAITAMRDSGLRGRYSYGPSSDPSAGSSFAQGSETVDFDDILRCRGQYFAGEGGRLHLGVACRGVEYSQPEIWQREFAWAREQGLPLTCHTQMTQHDVERVRAIGIYAEEGVLGPDLLLVHAIHVTDEEIAHLARTGTPVSLSIMSELRTGMGLPQTLRLMRGGVHVNLSADTMAASDNSDMFTVMRVTMCVERGVYEDATTYGPDAVLRQGTIDGATALGLGAVTGSITPGKKADLIALRATDINLGPLNVADGQVVLAAQPRNVEHVWIDGVLRKRDGELVDYDTAALMRDATARVAALAERIGKPVK